MNITFNLFDKDIETKFVNEAKELGLLNLHGPRAIGGIRASIYNGVKYEGCRLLSDFIMSFAKRNR